MKYDTKKHIRNLWWLDEYKTEERWCSDNFSLFFNVLRQTKLLLKMIIFGFHKRCNLMTALSGCQEM